MAGGVVRAASNKVSATKEIIMGLVLAAAGGMVWRSWHLSYKAATEDYYKKLAAEEAAASSS